MRATAPRRINPAQGRNSYTYIRGNAAPALPQEDYYGVPHKKLRRPKQKIEQNNDSFTRVSEKINPSIFWLLLCTVIIAGCAIGLLCVNANISALKTQIRETQALTQKTIASNERLENTLSEAVDMDEVKKIATTRLGMQTAAPHQIVKINVEKDSYSVQYDDQVADSKNKTILEKIGLR